MATTFLRRTSGTPTNSKKTTLSVWLKRSGLGTGTFFGGGSDSNNMTFINFNPNGKIFLQSSVSGSNTLVFITTQVFKDTSGWYNIVVAMDTTQATASNRVKLYVNGVQVTAFDTATYPSQNLDLEWNKSNKTLEIGKYLFQGTYSIYDGLMSHYNFVDGTAYAPTLFGETDSTTGQWKIKTAPSVTYGNNGFFILKDSNSVTDQSGKSNNFAVTGGTLTKTEDSPSNNFATLNPLVQGTSNNARTFANGNNTITLGRDSAAISSLGVTSGKYYCEIKCVTDAANPVIGIAKEGSPATVNPWGGSNLVGTNEYGYVSDGKKKGNAGSFTNYGSTWTTGDIISIAYNATIGAIWFGKNGTWQNNATDSQIAAGTTTYAAFTGLSGLFFFGCCDAATPTGDKFSSNFGNGYFGTTAVSSAGTNASGNGIFEYNVPAGFTGLSTKGLNL